MPAKTLLYMLNKHGVTCHGWENFFPAEFRDGKGNSFIPRKGISFNIAQEFVHKLELGQTFLDTVQEYKKVKGFLKTSKPIHLVMDTHLCQELLHSPKWGLKICE